jgi:hypothetical protein
VVVSDALARSRVDQRESEQLKQKAAADLRRIWSAAERIRRMTEIYRERLDGRRAE